MSIRYQASEDFLKRAQKVIPVGSQTFSKSRTQYPVGAAPLFVEKAKGSRIWDIDGNEYIDFNGALAALILGHADDDVNSAVTSQLQHGTIYPLPHTLETEVAEELQSLIPCAEMVRFGKNGSDATSGAVRVARAFTKKNYVLVCGYHGWQDWYIGSTARNLGVPENTRTYTKHFQYNDIESLAKLLKEHSGEVAAVILEPMNAVFPKNNFLQEVADLTRKNGALLVFDETITGFRLDLGGAQKVFGVTPDLATFGKGMANGFPLSALAGKAEYMRIMEDIFYSFTFGGETVSLAAGLATMRKLKQQSILPKIHALGETLTAKINKTIEKYDLQDVVHTSGHPSWIFLNFKDARNQTSWAIKTLFLQEIFKRGIIMIGTLNMYAAHTEKDGEKFVTVLDEVLDIVNGGLKKGNLLPLLECQPLQPLFKIR